MRICYKLINLQKMCSVNGGVWEGSVRVWSRRVGNWSSMSGISNWGSMGSVRDGDRCGDGLNDWSVLGIRVVLGNRVGKVSTQTVGFNHSGVESWGTGHVGGGCEWGSDDASMGNGNNGQESDDDLIKEERQVSSELPSY